MGKLPDPEHAIGDPKVAGTLLEPGPDLSLPRHGQDGGGQVSERLDGYLQPVPGPKAAGEADQRSIGGQSQEGPGIQSSWKPGEEMSGDPVRNHRRGFAWSHVVQRRGHLVADRHAEIGPQ